MCIWRIHKLASHIIYEARVHFGTRVPVPVLVWDSAIFEKVGCGCGGTRRLKNYLKYFYLYFLYIFTIKIFLKKYITMPWFTKQRKKKARNTSEVRISVVPVSFEADFGRIDRQPIRPDFGRISPIWRELKPIRRESSHVGANLRQKKKKKLKCSNDAWATASDVASHVGRGCNTLSAASVLPSI